MIRITVNATCQNLISLPRACSRCCSRYLGRLFDRCDNLRIGGAAAEIPRQIVANVLVAWIGIVLEQLVGHQHESRRAEAALECPASDESFLYVRQRAIGIEM